VPACNADLLDDGILDSLKFAELLLLLEQQFSIVNVNALELDDFRSVDRIAQFVMQLSARGI
jgi:acyl carrier protein